MEKYIFDCRENINDSPKFLKRNYKIDGLKSFSLKNSNHDYGINKQKVFDYSYYQSAPIQAVKNGGKKVNSLNSLIWQSIERQQNKVRREQSLNGEWKKQKENFQYFYISERKQHPVLKNHKRIKVPVKCMPPVGNYQYEDKTVRKKIIFDIKIKGKSLTKTKLTKPPHQQSPIEKGQVNKQNIDYKLILPKLVPKKSYDSGLSKKNILKDRIIEDEYQKFIQSIQISSVRRRLMQKYKLKGTKFDLSGHVQ